MENPTPNLDKSALIQQAQSLGFDACGVAPVDPPLRKDYYHQWIASGQHGDMTWMERNNERRLNPDRLLPEAQSIIMLGMNYYQPEPKRRGRIAKYALGSDYHNMIFKRLKQLCSWLRTQGGEQKPYVDTGPVLEKPIAAATQLGWQGKSTILIHPKQGTWLFLGTILTTLKIEADTATKDHCGSCTRCITACPTGAITAPYQLDASRCIAYLTIEHQGAIPEIWREAIGDHLFGCDDCLDVCPWNRWAQTTRESRFESRHYPDLQAMLAWSDDDFNHHFTGTPMKRLKRPRWLRNVAVVLGNIGTPDDLPALERAARNSDPLIAEHAQWAIGRIKKRHTNPTTRSTSPTIGGNHK